MTSDFPLIVGSRTYQELVRRTRGHRNYRLASVIVIVLFALGFQTAILGATEHRDAPFCTGWDHDPFGPDPSSVLLALRDPLSPGGEVQVLLVGNSRVEEADGVFDATGAAEFQLGISAMTTYTWSATTAAGEMLVRHEFVVLADPVDCSIDLLPAPASVTETTTETPPTTAETSKSSEPDSATETTQTPPEELATISVDVDYGKTSYGGDSNWALGWTLTGAAGLGLLAGGFFLARAKKDPCPELIKRCKDARQAADVARAGAAAAERASNDARSASGAASDAIGKAKRHRDGLDKPPGEGSWAESEGRRISSHDIHLRAAAASASLARWRSGESTAQECMDEWDHQSTDAGLDELREADATAREAAKAGADQSITDAENAYDAAAQASADAADAYVDAAIESSVADQAADAACKAAEPCMGQESQSASGATIELQDPIDEEPSPSSVPDDELPPSTPESTPEPDPASTPEEAKVPCFCGPDVTELFLSSLTAVGQKLEAGWAATSTTPVTEALGDGLLTLVDIFLNPLGLADYVVPTSTRMGYGLLWVKDNGWGMDYWLGSDDPLCPSCDHCFSGIPPATLLGECVEPHNLGDFLYGFCCGWWGLSGAAQDAGGFYAEVSNHPERATYEQSWSIESVSRPLYAAGSVVGNRYRESPGPITQADLAEMMEVADKRANCAPCPNKATKFSRSFNNQTWIWP